MFSCIAGIKETTGLEPVLQFGRYTDSSISEKSSTRR